VEVVYPLHITFQVHHSFSFVKDTFVSHVLLQFIQNNVKWKKNVCHYWETLTQNYS